MTLFKNIIIFIISSILASFFVYGSFAFGTDKNQGKIIVGTHEIKQSLVTIKTNSPTSQSLVYSPYTSGSTSTGILSLEFGRLSTAFVLAEARPILSFSGEYDIKYENFQGIISLYDPFSVYTLHPVDLSYQIGQITNGSFYISNEPDDTVSIYSIDAVVELTFFNQGEKMTDMILFPGMYIRFDPAAGLSLKGADLFKIMLVLGDNNSDKYTGLEFVNPRISNGSNDIFFMFKLPVSTRPLFQMLHLLFNERIKQVNLIKDYSSSRGLAAGADTSNIHNPTKKNYYLLDDLKSVLSRAVQSKMESADFRARIEQIYKESNDLVRSNSVQTTLEEFLTDARFAIYQPTISPSFSPIYTETASILKKIPDTGKGKFFQYLSDIYSLNIVAQKKDPTFSGIDTYTPTAEGLRRTLENNSIESKDYFDIALYAYQLLQKAQDGQAFTTELLSSKATYSFIETLFRATEKYIQGLPEMDQKSAYQTLVIQFYAPIAATLSRSLFSTYTTNIDNRIYLTQSYLDGDRVKNFDPKIREYLEGIYGILHHTYEEVAPLYSFDEQQYAFISYQDSLARIGGFIEMVTEGKYREYQKAPYVGTEIGGIYLPNIISGGKIEIAQLDIPVIPPVTSQPIQIYSGGIENNTFITSLPEDTEEIQ